MGDEIHSGARRPTSTSECLTFVKRKGHYSPAKQTKLKNSLLAGVGFLELANAMDFAANVWNTIPVPVFAAVLMGIGATIALAISVFAFQDAVLSRRNIVLLRDERQYLRKQTAQSGEEKGRQHGEELACQLDMRFREIGIELIDRIGMDSFMGLGAVLVAIGTFMAIGGANRRVFRASNLLSGYIGNAPSMIYGTVNAAWSVYIWLRAHHHGVAGDKQLRALDIRCLQRDRIRVVKMHATLNGFTGLIAGIAGLVTATRWWGYVVLAPCIVSAIYCNSVWRQKIGYERQSILHSPSVDHISTIEEIKFAALAQRLLRETPLKAFDDLVGDPQSITSVMEFIVMNGFYEDFCTRLLQDKDASKMLFESLPDELEIDSRVLGAAEEPGTVYILKIARTSVNKTGLARFRHRERFLLEQLGCELCNIEGRERDIEMNETKFMDSGPASSPTSVSLTS